MTLAGVMFDREAPVIEVADELGPLVVEVGKRLAGEGARRDLGQGLHKPGVERIEDRPGLEIGRWTWRVSGSMPLSDFSTP